MSSVPIAWGQTQRILRGLPSPVKGTMLRRARRAQCASLGDAVRLSNRRLACLAIAISALLPLGTAADNPAKRPVVILVGFAAGGGTDITARLVADSMQSALGRSVIVENKPGAGGGIAAVALKNAAPDGTTIMFAPTAVPVMAPLISRHLDYDPARDFAPVAQVATFQVAFAVSPESSATSIQEFMAWAKMHGNQANFGTVAAGSLPHLFGREVARLAGVDMVHIAYKGFPQLSGDLMGGRIPRRDRCPAQPRRTPSRGQGAHHRDIRRGALLAHACGGDVRGTRLSGIGKRQLDRRLRARQHVARGCRRAVQVDC